jgi:hypothetical protein
MILAEEEKRPAREKWGGLNGIFIQEAISWLGGPTGAVLRHPAEGSSTRRGSSRGKSGNCSPEHVARNVSGPRLAIPSVLFPRALSERRPSLAAPRLGRGAAGAGWRFAMKLGHEK